jgi:hypothetical protein
VGAGDVGAGSAGPSYPGAATSGRDAACTAGPVLVRS